MSSLGDDRRYQDDADHKQHKSHKEHKHKHKEHKHKSKSKDREKDHSLGQLDRPSRVEEVGSEPESGEILGSGGASPVALESELQAKDADGKHATSKKVGDTDYSTAGRNEHRDLDVRLKESATSVHEEGSRNHTAGWTAADSKYLYPASPSHHLSQHNGDDRQQSRHHNEHSRRDDNDPHVSSRSHRDGRGADGSHSERHTSKERPSSKERLPRSERPDRNDGKLRDRGPDKERERDRDRDRERVRDRDYDRARDGSSRPRGAEDRPDSRSRDFERGKDKGGRDRDRDYERDRSEAIRRDRDRDERPRHRDDRGREREDRDHGRGRGEHGRDASRKRSRSGERYSSRHQDEQGKRRQREQDEDDKHGRNGADAMDEDEGDHDLLVQMDEDEEQRAIEERRRRLMEIKAKHSSQQQLADAVANPTAFALAQKASRLRVGSEQPTSEAGTGGQATMADTAATADGPPASQQVPEDGDKTPEGDRTSSSDDGGVADGPVLDIWGNEVTADDADSGAVHAATADQVTQPATEHTRSIEAERIKATEVTTAKQKVEDLDDMFAEEDDMFAEAAAAGEEGGGEREVAIKRPGAALADAYDDHEGYYNFQVGEVMDGRYEVFASNGKGVFSVVVRARDLQRRDETQQHPEVAIKLIRANETMYKAAQLELNILRKLCAADPENRKHCIKLLRHFDYRNHMCLVFEPMAMNLRDLTKKYGRNKGLNIEAVQLFACQLLIALRHLRKNNVLHADIKPDNILINHRHNKIKLCDFGSAMMMGDNEITPYLISRFYRAPEVILGMKYDYAMDMWSIGCVIYELFTGRILFPGHTNNEMLKLMMDVKGPFTKKMLRKCAFTDKHFDSDPNMSFISLEDDPITKTKVRKLIPNPQVKHSLATLLSRTGSDKNKIQQLVDLLDKMMMLEPERRIDPDAALRHPFVKDFLPKKEHGSRRGKNA